MGTQTKVGKNAKLYHGVAGSKATTELTRVKDVTVTLELTTDDDTGRDSGNWESQVPLHNKCQIKWAHKAVDGDSGLAAIRAAWLAQTPIALCAKDKESGEGPDADFIITGFDRNEPVKGHIYYDVTASVTTANRTPVWATS